MHELRHAAIFSLIVLCAGAPAVTRATGEEAPSCPADARWGAVIDAGSSGSRLRYYCWRPGAGGALPWVEDAGSEKVEPGIADAECSRAPEEAVARLRPLIEGARRTIGEEESARTPLALMATAGLRQCPRGYREAMLAGIREYLAGTPFKDPRAELITGDDEARYGWTSVNYLLGHLEPGKALETVGALDLGGVSTQITFLPGSCTGPQEACGELSVGEHTFPLYAHSYLGWGQDEAMRKVASRACYLRGYRREDGAFTGRGRYRACRRAIRKGIAHELRERPPEPPCARSCSRLGFYQPPLEGDLVAFSAYAYNTGFLGLGPELTLEQLQAAGRSYCRTTWREAAAGCAASPRPGCREEWLNRYCFSAAYIVTLLHEVYGLPMDRAFTSTNELAGAGIDWTLGVMVQIAESQTATGDRER